MRLLLALILSGASIASSYCPRTQCYVAQCAFCVSCIESADVWAYHAYLQIVALFSRHASLSTMSQQCWRFIVGASLSHSFTPMQLLADIYM